MVAKAKLSRKKKNELKKRKVQKKMIFQKMRKQQHLRGMPLKILKVIGQFLMKEKNI